MSILVAAPRGQEFVTNKSGQPEGQPLCDQKRTDSASLSIFVAVMVLLMNLLGGLVLLAVDLLALLLIQ